METHFQTSFIPRRPMPNTPGSLAPQVPKKNRDSRSIFMTIAIIVFVCSVLSIGGVYGWKQYLIGSQASLEKDLATRQREFNLDQISLIKAQSSKIMLAKNLLNNHLMTSKIFSVISQMTSESIRFLSLDLTVPVGTASPLEMTLVGYGRDFPSVAFQSDVLNQLEKYGLRSIVKNAIVFDPALNRNGTVSFGFTAQIDPTTFSYMRNVGNTAGAAGAVTGTTTRK